MIVIVDANIILSGIINPFGTIPELIFLKGRDIEFVTPDYTLEEIRLHKNRICKETSLLPSTYMYLLDELLSNILVFSSDVVSTSAIKAASSLVASIDEKDMLYVAFTVHLEGLLWTGDRKLYRG